MAVRFVLNGKPVFVTDTDPEVPLLEWLRASGYTGAKEGCAEGECGACAVARVGRDARGRARYEAVNSCLVPLGAVHEEHLVTVEGVGEEGLHPVQERLIARAGSQCGFCTPGFVVSMFCEFYRPGRVASDPEAIGGNLCRCTGYRSILEALAELPAPAPSDPRLVTLRTGPAAFSPLDYGRTGARFFRPTALADALDLLARHPEAVPIAGGTDLMVYANQRQQRFPTLVALDKCKELARIDVAKDEIVIGAAVSLSELEERVQEGLLDVPLFAGLLPLFSSRLIRNRATLGGNLATASPIGDALPVLLALDAELTLASRAASRRLRVDEFLLGYRKSALEPGELVVSVHVPLPAPALQRFYKVSKRRLDDISTIAGAFTLELTADARVARLSIAFGGIAETAVRARDVERACMGEPWTEATLRRALPGLEAVGTPLTDHRGSDAYRRAIRGKLFEKFFAETTGEGP